MLIRPVQSSDGREWLRLRDALWPGIGADTHATEMAAYRARADRAVFVADRGQGRLGGFLEAGARDVAEGCESSPVGYVEGWYVDPDLRRSGIGAALVAAAERWAVQLGCHEMASDCVLDNQVSLAAHLALGYVESDRLIHFRKALGPSGG